MDKQYTDHPTSGVLTMKNILFLEGFIVNAKRVRRLMHKMNLVAIYPKKNLSKHGKFVYLKPYLLRGMRITHPNQV